WRRELCERTPAGAVRKLLKMSGKTRHAPRDPVFHAALRGSGGTQARAGRRRSDDASGVALRNAPNRDRGGELWLPPAVGGGCGPNRIRTREQGIMSPSPPPHIQEN